MKKTILLTFATLLSVAMTAQNDRRLDGMKDVNGVRDVTLDSLAKANQVRQVSGSTRKGKNPL